MIVVDADIVLDALDGQIKAIENLVQVDAEVVVQVLIEDLVHIVVILDLTVHRTFVG